MRLTILPLLFLFAACGGGGDATDLGADAPADAGTTDLGVDADVDAGDDAASSLRPCMPVHDVGTCPAGEHCSITDLAGMLSYGNCVSLPGTPPAEGAACTRVAVPRHASVLADNCGDQRTCDRPNASHPTVCYRLCAQTTDCHTGELCQVIATMEGSGMVEEGLCVPDAMCNPLTGTGCAAVENCAVLRDTHTGGFGTLCLDVSATPVADGAMCSSSTLCAQRSVCANRRYPDGGIDSTMPVCQRYCDTSAPDAGCAMAAPCIAYPGDMGVPAGLGLCAP
jgi:hypothetical protein